MTANISVTESQCLEVLGRFVDSLLGIEGIVGQDNLVPEPNGQDFYEMTFLMEHRISTNVTSYDDCVFIGSVSGKTLAVSDLINGAIAVGHQLFGANVPAGTLIVSGSGPYTLNNSMTLSGVRLSTGVRDDLSPKEVTIQVDMHGPNSVDNTGIIETMFRSDWAFDFFKSTGYDIRPLYCTDPKQMAFRNGEQQIENRWSIDMTMQINPIVEVPQQFADILGDGMHIIQADQ